MSHTWTSHVAHVAGISGSARPGAMYEWVMSRTWMSHVAHVNESCRIYEWVMSHMLQVSVAAHDLVRLAVLLQLSTIFPLVCAIVRSQVCVCVYICIYVCGCVWESKGVCTCESQCCDNSRLFNLLFALSFVVGYVWVSTYVHVCVCVYERERERERERECSLARAPRSAATTLRYLTSCLHCRSWTRMCVCVYIYVCVYVCVCVCCVIERERKRV